MFGQALTVEAVQRICQLTDYLKLCKYLISLKCQSSPRHQVVMSPQNPLLK